MFPWMAPKKHKVLISDDYEADRYFLKELIRRHAPLLEVVGEVQDGEEVIAYLWGYGKYADREQHPLPELLIMDVRMPRMTGIQVLEWMKTQTLPPMKVAVLADSSSALFRDRARDLGLKHFYSKLMSPQEMGALITSLQSELEAETPSPAAPPSSSDN
jgi:DNA-binding NarL/FixJ family response regulator